MRRRELLPLLCGAVAWPLAARALQHARRVRRIGVLSASSPSVRWIEEGLREGLKEHGFAEGQDVELEYRWARGRFDLLPTLAAELVALGVEVIVSVVTAASLAARSVTTTVPIVMVGVGDPVGVGLVGSLARPGGNITGTSTLQPDMAGKQLELVRMVDPTLSRVAVLWNPANAAFQALQLTQAQAAARVSGMELRLIEATSVNDFPAVFPAARDGGTRALIVLGDPTFTVHREALAELAVRDGLITVCGTREYAEAGCLISYGPDYFDATKRAASYVARILKGEEPGDLPVEQSTRFDLVINMRTARALGLDVPLILLARADKVIE